MGRENDVFRPKVLKMLCAFYPEGMWETRHIGTFDRAGAPDITGCLRGRYVGIELKVGVKDAESARRPAQRIWHKQFVLAGGAYLCTADETMEEIHIFCRAVLDYQLERDRAVGVEPL